MELVEMLKSQLGVSEKQASGGAGLLLKLAKDKLGENFSQVAGAIPETEQLICSAPAACIVGKLGGLVSSLGGNSAQLGNLASLAGGLKKLDIDTSTISKFIPILLSFAQSKGGDSVKGLLEKIFK